MSAAINVHDVTSDRRGVGQVHDRIRDVLDRRRPTHRRQALHHVLRSIPVKRRVDGAGSNSIHANAVFRVLHRQVLGNRFQTASATRLEAATSADWVTFRELATTLKLRSTNPFTILAPIPCDAPVTMAVFRVLLMVVYLANDFSLG